MCDFKIGDIVEITRPGLTYSQKTNFFLYFNFNNKSINPQFKIGEVGTIFGIRQHDFWTHETILILAIQHEDGRQCLIETDGVIKHINININNRKPFKLYRKWGLFNDLSF